MDFGQFNYRKAAEEGAEMRLNHPLTNEPIEAADGKHPFFVVRGSASKSAQARIAEMQRAAKKAAEKAVDEDGADEDAAFMEAMHDSLVDGAMSYIIRAGNMTVGGKPVEDDKDLIREVLAGTFPELEQVRDGNGKSLFDEVDGTRVPRFELSNFPFAKQVLDYAGKQENFSKAASTS